jgi:hypothetical protein
LDRRRQSRKIKFKFLFYVANRPIVLTWSEAKRLVAALPRARSAGSLEPIRGQT